MLTAIAIPSIFALVAFLALAAAGFSLFGFITGYESQQITEAAMNALNAATGVIVDADIAPLTTKAGLIALWVATGKPWTQGQDVQFHQRSIQAACDADIFTDTNIAAADTMNGLRDILITANSSLNRSYQSGFRWWS